MLLRLRVSLLHLPLLQVLVLVQMVRIVQLLPV